MNARPLILIASVLTISLSVIGTAQAKLKEAEAAFQAGDFATALKELKPYLKKKRQPATANLMMARMYLEGLGVPANYSKAWKHLQRPAKSGNAWAATEIGKLYLQGDGVIQSYAKARDWFEKAAKAGYGPAQVELGHLHRSGLSVAVDPLTAYAWYNLAASGLSGQERDTAIQARDQVGGVLSEAQIHLAQEKSYDWSERFEVVEPETVGLLDQAAILAEEKFEKANEEIRKLSEEISKQMEKATAAPTEKPDDLEKKTVPE